MNFAPARVTWLLVALAATVVPGCSRRKAFRIGWRQHAPPRGSSCAGGRDRRRSRNGADCLPLLHASRAHDLHRVLAALRRLPARDRLRAAAAPVGLTIVES